MHTTVLNQENLKQEYLWPWDINSLKASGEFVRGRQEPSQTFGIMRHNMTSYVVFP